MVVRPPQRRGHLPGVVARIKDVELARARPNLPLQAELKVEVPVGPDGVDDAAGVPGIAGPAFLCEPREAVGIADLRGEDGGGGGGPGARSRRAARGRAARRVRTHFGPSPFVCSPTRFSKWHKKLGS